MSSNSATPPPSRWSLFCTANVHAVVRDEYRQAKREATLARFKYEMSRLGRINLYIINKKDIDLAVYKSFLCIPAPLLVDHFSAHI